MPHQTGFIPTQRKYFFAETDMLAQARALDIALDIGFDLIALGEEMVPVIVIVERIGVEMVGGIDADPGIGIFIPGAANIVILLDDREGNAGFLHLDTHADA